MLNATYLRMLIEDVMAVAAIQRRGVCEEKLSQCWGRGGTEVLVRGPDSCQLSTPIPFEVRWTDMPRAPKTAARLHYLDSWGEGRLKP